MFLSCVTPTLPLIDCLVNSEWSGIMASIVICEKASQATHVREALGTRFGRVLPARGHIMRLKEPQEENEAWLKWTTELLHPGTLYDKVPSREPGARKLLEDIREAARTADTIVIATDCDREGQLIGQEIVEHIRFRGRVLRAMFSAEDPKSLQDAFSKLAPNEQYHGLYLSAVAREQADQITNLSLTRAATVTFKAPGSKGAIGIGRVKTPVLGIVCRREKEILNFRSSDYFEIVATATAEKGSLELRCSRLPGRIDSSANETTETEVAEDEGFADESLTDAGSDSMQGRIMDRSMAEAVAVAATGFRGPLSIKQTEKKQSPPKLFDLTALQSACSTRFGWSGDKTLATAQALYSEHKILTYPRGEARYLPENAIDDVSAMAAALTALRDYRDIVGLVDKPVIRKGKSGHFSDKALEGLSHHAIVPNANMADDFASILPKLNADERGMFDLVARSWLAALAPDYRYRQTTVEMSVLGPGGNWRFINVGNVAIDLGWRAISGRAANDAPDIPPLCNGELAVLSELRIQTKQTKPPARYSEGSLIKAMQDAWRFVPDPEKKARLKDAKGIGTPATRAEIIKGLFQQGQFERLGKMIKPSKAGMRLYELVMSTAPEIADPGRTAEWETIFTHVERGGMTAEDAVMRISKAAAAAIAKFIEAGKNGSISINAGKTSRPSQKVVAFATSLAKQKGIDLPSAILKNTGQLRAWLDANAPRRERNADGSYPPSEKQVAMAKEFASRANIELPSATLSDGKACSAFIDRMMKARPPSEKQIAFARKLADEKGVSLPSNAEVSSSACSAFIDMMSKVGGKASGGRLSGAGALPLGKSQSAKRKFGRPGAALPRPRMR